ALKPETGEYIWHYQETPADTWDFTATQPITLATLPIGGFYRQRHTGEAHAYSAQLMHLLQTAVSTDSYSSYLQFARGVAD
ncbi:hypothetical protein CVH10_23910, partial [Halomonas sp. ND22Bw]|uniref:hypothetical protein n=1 Tax=Halomonas sp. ND22Bw TaxID=2054178 RepID=UPI000D2E721F